MPRGHDAGSNIGLRALKQHIGLRIDHQAMRRAACQISLLMPPQPTTIKIDETLLWQPLLRILALR